MTLFTGLFSSQVQEQPSRKKEVVTLMGIGNFELRIVGEAHYQAALEDICGTARVERCQSVCNCLANIRGYLPPGQKYCACGDARKTSWLSQS